METQLNRRLALQIMAGSLENRNAGVERMLNFSGRFSLWAFVIWGVLGGAERISAQPPAAPMPMPEESPLLIEPESPEEAIEAAVLMQRLARPGLAKRYINQFLNANPDEATLLKIRDKYGPAIFLKMATDRDLQPESKTLYDKITAAFRKRAANPQRINKLIQDLTGSPRERAVAIASLRSAGPVVVPTNAQTGGERDRRRTQRRSFWAWCRWASRSSRRFWGPWKVLTKKFAMRPLKSWGMWDQRGRALPVAAGIRAERTAGPQRNRAASLDEALKARRPADAANHALRSTGPTQTGRFGTFSLRLPLAL